MDRLIVQVGEFRGDFAYGFLEIDSRHWEYSLSLSPQDVLDLMELLVTFLPILSEAPE